MTTPSDANSDSAGRTTTAAATPLWEDFVDIFHSPSQVFARRENGNFWVPMLIVTLAVTALFVATRGLSQPVMDAEFQRGAAAAMRKNPQLTEEQMATAHQMTDKFAWVFPLIFVPVGIFLTGIALWLVGKLFDATESAKTALVVTAYAFVPKIVEIVVNAAQMLIMDTSSITSHYAVTLGAGRFLDPDTASPFMLALLGRVDVFTIWVTVLLAIGLSVTGKIPRTRAAMAAACVWVIGALPALFGALRS